MTTTHIMSDETGQLILAQLQAISQALDDGALSNSQIDTVLADQSPTGAGFLDGGGLKRFFDGLQAQFADISHNHSGDALTPASVAATGAVSGSSISDGTGTLAQLRESVSFGIIDVAYAAGARKLLLVKWSDGYNLLVKGQNDTDIAYLGPFTTL